KEVVGETFTWLEREMRHPDGGLYSALDADSEGVEGKFYTWTSAEAKEALGADFEEAAAYFNITQTGNWEHGRNILMRDVSRNNDEKTTRWKNKLMDVRAKRIRPGLDNKILTGWNAMAIKGLADAYGAFGDKKFLTMALRCIAFIEKNLIVDKRLRRTTKDTEGFLEDYSFMIQAYVALYQVTGDESWVMKAKEMCEYVVANFYDPSDGYFFYTSSKAEKLIARKKEIFDNVIPASNSVMAMNLLVLGTIFDNNSWKDIATQMTGKLLKTIESEPTYLSNWGMCLAAMTTGLAEVAIVGSQSEEFLQKFSLQFLPFAIIQSSKGSSNLPLLSDKKTANNATTVYVCYNRTCKLPVHSVEEAIGQLK
ncbi:MAG TPA: thioredoxin domain-containing protein, partial [Cyclobacteriaceae bacterium]|nr:thioredoxin domain-containing protein [Cyclobacteriaceae bacterium]